MRKTTLKTAGIWFAAFLVFTLIVMFVGVAPAGHPIDADTTVGLAFINVPFFEFFYNLLGDSACVAFYQTTQVCGLIAMAVVFCMALSGLSQLLKRKSFHFVDPKIYAMGFYYIIIGAIYLFFTKFAVNYRPLYINNAELEASYPSSHTVLALTVVVALIKFADNFAAEEKKAQVLYRVVTRIFIVITILCRLLSCVHWLTDIIGAVLLSVAIICLYDPLCAKCTEVHNKIEARRIERQK